MENFESPRTARKRLIKELIQGKEFVVQLQTLLQQPLAGDHQPDSAHDLILKIWASFTDALSELTAFPRSKGLFQIPEAADNLGSKDFGSEFRKDKLQVKKNRSGRCYRRRKNSESWMMRKSAKKEDEYEWRKYGHKCYYRCTYKYDQECQATKRIQRIKEDPIIYQTTYFGHHICKRLQKEPQCQITITPESSGLMREYPPFEANPKVPCKNDQPPSSDNPTTKEEEEEESKEQTDSNIWKDFMVFSPSVPAIMAADDISTSLHGLDIDGIFGDFHFAAATEFS